MSRRSYFAYYERHDLDHYDEDHPVSTMRAFVTRNNLEHVIDTSAQHRMNFIKRSPTGGNYSAEGTYGDRMYPLEFRWTMFADKVPSLYVRADFTTLDDDEPLDVLIRCIPASAREGDKSVPSLFELTGTTTGGTTLSIEEFLTPADYDQEGLSFALTDSLVAFDSDEGGTFVRPTISLMRLEVFFTETANISESVHAMTRLYLRESA